MKKKLLLPFLALLCAIGHAQPKISDLSFPKSVQLFGLYELSFQLGDYPNAYDPEVIDVYAEFIGPDGKLFKVNGFYYEGYSFQQRNGYEVATAARDKGWRVRFTPNQAGRWRFRLHAIDRTGKCTYPDDPQVQSGFECNPVSQAQGFIRQANTKYLKREAVENGKVTTRAFFPIGPNIAWYSYKGSKEYPTGVFEYDTYLNQMAGSANYMRIWISRSICLSLYGPEYTQMNGKSPMVYFDSSLNQKDAAELDHIIANAAKNGIAVMPCFFTFGDFSNRKEGLSRWNDNPYKTLLGLKSPSQFFTDDKAKRIAKNLIRYIVARWGYATNIICWELWNEVNNIDNEGLTELSVHTAIVKWHGEMADYVRSIDPFNHLISTSLGTFSENDYIGKHIYQGLDVVQYHTYGNIQKAKSKEQRTRQLYDKYAQYRPLYPDKPVFCGEFGFGQSSSPKYQDKDPYGFDTHNCAWASLFSGSMGSASFWFWDYLRDKELMRIYAPVMAYSLNLPILTDAFSPHTTASIVKKSLVCPNGIETYYLTNAHQDTIYGWCQDTAFSYQALRRLTDKEIKNGHFVANAKVDTKGYIYTLSKDKRPKPCSKSNTITIPISEQSVGTQYSVRWFDGETGLEIVGERTVVKVQRSWPRNRFINIEFPSTIRDLKKRQINNTYGDAAFIIIADDGKKEGSKAQSTAPYKHVKVVRPSKGESHQ